MHVHCLNAHEQTHVETVHPHYCHRHYSLILGPPSLFLHTALKQLLSHFPNSLVYNLSQILYKNISLFQFPTGTFQPSRGGWRAQPHLQLSVQHRPPPGTFRAGNTNKSATREENSSDLDWYYCLFPERLSLPHYLSGSLP